MHEIAVYALNFRRMKTKTLSHIMKSISIRIEHDTRSNNETSLSKLHSPPVFI